MEQEAAGATCCKTPGLPCSLISKSSFCQFLLLLPCPPLLLCRRYVLSKGTLEHLVWPTQENMRHCGPAVDMLPIAWKQADLNEQQQDVVHSVIYRVQHADRPRPPFICFGPPGTGESLCMALRSARSQHLLSFPYTCIFGDLADVILTRPNRQDCHNGGDHLSGDPVVGR